MNSNQLKQFIAIAEEENITRASQKLFMSQSALSNTLKLLEEELDCQLFDRKSNRLVLNTNGMKLFGYAKQAIKLIETAEQEFKVPKRKKCVIKIVTSSHMYFTSFFKKNIALMSKYHLKVMECSYSDVFEFLDGKNCDMVLAPDYPKIHKGLARFERVLLGEEQLCVVFPIEHPLSVKNFVCTSELHGEQFFSFENDIEFRWQDYLFMQKGYSVDYCVELPRGYTRTNDISDLKFPCFLSSLVKESVASYKSKYKCVPLGDSEAIRSVYLWYKKDSTKMIDTIIKEFL